MITASVMKELIKVETTLKQRTLFWRYFNVRHWPDVVSTLWNVKNPTSDFALFSMSDQRYFNVDAQCWNNVDPTMKCWLGKFRTFVWTCYTWNNCNMENAIFFLIQSKHNSMQIQQLHHWYTKCNSKEICLAGLNGWTNVH